MNNKLIIYSGHISPIYIELQYKSIKRFIKNFTYIVINDAVGESHMDKKCVDLSVNFDKINEVCKKLNINCIKFDNNIHKKHSIPGPCNRCADVTQFINDHCYNNYKEGFLMILDSDMFFLKEFDVEKYMGEFHCSGIIHNLTNYDNRHIITNEKYGYFWNALFILNLKYINYLKELDWSPGLTTVDGKKCNSDGILFHGDVGAYTNTFVTNNIDKIKKISTEETSKIGNKLYSLHVNFEKNKIQKYRQLLLDESIIHLLRGGNWDCKTENYIETQINILSEFFEKYIL